MFFSAVTVLGVLFTAFVVFVLAMRASRRRSRQVPADTVSYDFSLDELHRLLHAGQLSPHEFERAKAVVLARQAARAAQPVGPSGHGFEVLPPSPVAPAPQTPQDSPRA